MYSIKCDIYTQIHTSPLMYYYTHARTSAKCTFDINIVSYLQVLLKTVYCSDIATQLALYRIYLTESIDLQRNVVEQSVLNMIFAAFVFNVFCESGDLQTRRRDEI